MGPLRQTRWASLAVPALCLLGYLGLFAPPAHAGCGGDVVHRPGQPAAHPMPAEGPDPATPCHGPGCRQSQAPPLAPPAPPPSKVQPDAALTSRPAAEPAPVGVIDRDSSVPPSQFPSSIFRPPR
jgi:hypothetical protein